MAETISIRLDKATERRLESYTRLHHINDEDYIKQVVAASLESRPTERVVKRPMANMSWRDTLKELDLD
ncbi:hypothetical protein FC99_GL001171 [Levilactobacillus koreensis JCM 16448]|uniref:Uncharacterized protein n=1 Tax=Levilactobacillus koreensis TaxID=637971 RepID=A0AAC8ZGM1_9LACO|nr:hypothetical protein [Levilactobacillus koreensis]AKP64154.1 hypothetical protein ABN16_03500 [Levilactobacillus koreensis]KRK86926.1 hypothetical protein FC99_GL001171 [Levilactobacillus koreensis JCM 16448]